MKNSKLNIVCLLVLGITLLFSSTATSVTDRSTHANASVSPLKTELPFEH